MKSDKQETGVIHMEDLPPPPPYEDLDEDSQQLDDLKFASALYKSNMEQLQQRQSILLAISSLLFALLLWALDRRKGKRGN